MINIWYSLKKVKSYWSLHKFCVSLQILSNQLIFRSLDSIGKVPAFWSDYILCILSTCLRMWTIKVVVTSFPFTLEFSFKVNSAMLFPIFRRETMILSCKRARLHFTSSRGGCQIEGSSKSHWFVKMSIHIQMYKIMFKTF